MPCDNADTPAALLSQADAEAAVGIGLRVDLLKRSQVVYGEVRVELMQLAREGCADSKRGACRTHDGEEVIVVTVE